jgi:hypothetical protein
MKRSNIVSRREFVKTIVAGTGLAAVGTTAFVLVMKAVGTDADGNFKLAACPLLTSNPKDLREPILCPLCTAQVGETANPDSPGIPCPAPQDVQRICPRLRR